MKADKTIALMGAGIVALAAMAKKKSVAGIGSTDNGGYVILIHEEYRDNYNLSVFEGWSYKDGEKWVKQTYYNSKGWYDEKVYKSLAAAERQIPLILEKLIDGVTKYECEIITWDEFVKKFVKPYSR